MGEIEAIVELQAELIAALDARDVESIERATRSLADALEKMRRRSAVVSGGQEMRDKVSYALKQSDAAKTRVNFLAVKNREKMEQLAELRRPATGNVYGNRGNLRVPALQA